MSGNVYVLSITCIVCICMQCIMGQNDESCRSDYGSNCFANSTLCEPYTVSSSDRCDYVHCCCSNYASHEALFDYIYFQYCATWNKNNEISNAILMIIMGIYFILILGNVADNFFAPIMAETAETLGVSHNIAGVTFLAFANGAPDISSSIAAFQMGGEQIKLGLGALLGVAVFNPIFISSVISTYAVNEPIKVVRFPFVRDCIFLFLAASSILRITLNGKIVIIEAVAMVLLYIIYVTTAVCSEIYSKKKKKNDLKTATAPAAKSGTYKSLDNVNDNDKNNDINNNNNDADQYYPSAKHLWASIKHTQSLAASLAAQSIDIHHTDNNNNNDNNTKKHWCLRGTILILYGPIYIARLIMRITIPLTDKEAWNDKFAVITCITSPMFFCFVFELFETGYYWIFALIFGIIMGIITYYLCQKKYKSISQKTIGSGVELKSNKPKVSESMQDLEGIKDEDNLSSQPVMKYFFLLLGFLASVAWINFAAVEVVTIL
eukprot:28556_1